MAFEADKIIHHRRLKRYLTLWRAVAIAALAVIAVMVFGVHARDALRGRAHIARLHIDGVIHEDTILETRLRKLADDTKTQAVIVRIDSPGGTVVGGENLFYGLRGIAEKKPVVVVMGSTATSAAYMAAIAADRIFARAGSITGSIGVVLQSAEISGLLGKIGITPITIKSSPLKAQPNFTEPLDPAARKANRDVVMDLYAMFVDLVAERRHMTPTQIGVVADGRVFTGRQALKAGLIDEIGAEPEALRWLHTQRGLDAKLPVVDVSAPPPIGGWFSQLTGMIGKTLFSERVRLDGVLALWHPGRG
ncbi:signal peptide peptidase SppA [Varunaivibrio sulfuroxidans]|uniref:Signal peptide peptidase A n=1 Tax=Varunaivibrio sulfuroxidans TaxID=1773489 RepID=A0A4R3J6Z8_9PROT|nr:signal peptide peptidase SppA [Varunaivibrio sulfuroxidans]TCS61628.1 signal peptide peptidase A [Varunaivibrio sulfuroxidans]WES29500.1 signal peptide peptidase SppA [Varunaivibrio sulfuroxidans]